MTYKRFTYIPFDGFEDNGEFITPYQVVKLLNELHKENDALKQVLKTKVVVNRQYEELQILKKENEQLKEHQRTLEAKIVRLKDRVKTFEKHYSLKDIERYKKMDNCNCITSKRLDE